MITNWKTTVAGIAAAAVNLWAAGGFASNWKTFVVSAGMAALGIFAKDASTATN